MLDWLTDPYASAFMQRALLAVLVVGVVAPLVGVWIVLRRLAYLGDAMSHATLAGVGAASVGGLSVTAGAIGAALVMALLMAALAAHPRLRDDAVVGVVGVALLAAGVILISSRGDVTVDLGHILFGSVTTVTTHDVVANAVLGAITLTALALLFGDLRAASFDPLHARLVGIRVGTIATALLVLLAVTVVLALQTVGVLMSIALFVVPPAAARLWTRTVEAMSALAVAFGAGSAVAGLTVAYHAATPPGATIALATVSVLVVSVVATLPRRGTPPAAHAA